MSVFQWFSIDPSGDQAIDEVRRRPSQQWSRATLIGGNDEAFLPWDGVASIREGEGGGSASNVFQQLKNS